jgi:hypothetical protein
MSQWFDRLRFFWEEEIAPPAEVPHVGREAPSGVPRPLRKATRFALVGTVATSLMAQVIGVRLTAPVDAAPSYCSTCSKDCTTKCGAKNPTCVQQCKQNNCPQCLK